MKPLKKPGDQDIPATGRPDVTMTSRQTWWSMLVWTVLTVLVFLILARLGFKAAQARRVTWLVAVCGACLAAVQALVCEVHQPRRLPFSLLILLGGVGGLLVAHLLGVLQVLPVGNADLLVGALFGMCLSGLGCLRR